MVSLKILNCNVIAYADDLAVVVHGSNTELLLLSVELAMRTIEAAMERLGIALAAEKTEGMLWSGPSQLVDDAHATLRSRSLKLKGGYTL